MYVLNCEIVPFPLTKRVIVQNLARMLFAYRPDTAERRLASDLNFQRQSLLRKGIAADVVEREVRALENAIRAELSTIKISPGGDAA